MSLDEREIWLDKFILGASARIARKTEVKEQAFVVSPSGSKYYVLQKMGGASCYSVYGCIVPSEDGTKKTVSLFKIATTPNENKLLETEALVLTRLRDLADEIDQKRPKGSKPFNYGYFFPSLVESFVSEKQGNRRINILSFPDPIDSTIQLTQLSNLISKERLYVDPRTSVWILGKTLKILGLVHNANISNGRVDGSNLLIERDRHGVIVFDWTFSQIFGSGIPVGIRRLEVVQVVQMAIKAMGGDPQTGISLSDGVGGQYSAIINKLITGEFYNADEAHQYFYQEVGKIWPREYWPFTSIPVREEV